MENNDYSKYLDSFDRFYWLSEERLRFKTFMEMTREEVEWRLKDENVNFFYPLRIAVNPEAAKEVAHIYEMFRWRLSLTDEEWNKILLIYKLGGR